MQKSAIEQHLHQRCNATYFHYIRHHIFSAGTQIGQNRNALADFGKVVKNRAYSYEQENGVYIKKNLNYSNVGATSLFTTVEDLAKWALNFENPKIGGAQLIGKFNEPAFLDDGKPAILAVVDGETIYHAKGQFVRNYRGLNLYNHTGGDAGFRTYLARFPDQKFSVIVLSNDYAFQSLKSGLDIAEFYLKDELKKKALNQTTVKKRKINSLKFLTAH